MPNSSPRGELEENRIISKLLVRFRGTCLGHVREASGSRSGDFFGELFGTMLGGVVEKKHEGLGGKQTNIKDVFTKR